MTDGVTSSLVEGGVGPSPVDRGLMCVGHEIFNMSHFVVNCFKIFDVNFCTHFYSEKYIYMSDITYNRRFQTTPRMPLKICLIVYN